MKRNNHEPIVVDNAEALSRKVADWLIECINEGLERSNRFTIALSGGNTPKKLFTLLASDAYKNRVDWAKVHFFWGDERNVPYEDERNNAKMAFDTLLNHIPVKQEHIHIMRTDISPDESAAEYEAILHRYFDEQPYSFDVVLLGLGDNAHTLSLFPEYENIHEKTRQVMAFYLQEQKMYRITLTAPIVNRSARVAFVVSGADKAVAVSQVLYGEHNPDFYPAQLIQPYAEAPFWFMDEAAATELQD